MQEAIAANFKHDQGKSSVLVTGGDRHNEEKMAMHFVMSNCLFLLEQGGSIV
jgi:hypothetical protein